MRIIGQRVKRLREEKVWTQQHLAEAAGINVRTIQRIEKGGAPSNETLLSLAAAFDIDISELIEIQEIMEDLNKVKTQINKGVLGHIFIWAVFTIALLLTQPIYVNRGGSEVMNEIFYNSIGWGCGIILHIVLAWGRFFYFKPIEY